MGAFSIFIIRAIIAVLMALIISRMFFKEIPISKVAGLALVLLGFAYLFQYVKKRDRGGNDGK
jgi:hypothetical protein